MTVLEREFDVDNDSAIWFYCWFEIGKMIFEPMGVNVPFISEAPDFTEI